jgi:site-specific recombinase XerD
MASIYKKGRDRKKKKKHALWYIDYFDHAGKRKTRKGFTDKSKTEQLAARLELQAHLRRTGMIDPQQEELAKQRLSGVEEHLLEFEKSLRRRRNTTKHVCLIMSRVRRVVEGCEFKTLADIRAEKVECFLGESRDEEDFGHRTYNHYVQAFEQFCSWLSAKGRLATNPVVGLPRLNCETDVRRKRRALSPEDFGKLVQSARSSTEDIQCFNGESRARIYLLSYMTGLRRSELASLTPNSFKLDATPATLTVAATISKHRRKDVLPIHPDLVVMLRDWLKGIEPDQFMFPRLARRRTWLMVKKDLERAGIPYVTPDGVADFHAAGRHTHITELLRNGATLPEARELARHSDIKMTMKYTHIGIDDQAKALAALPNPCQHIVSSSGDFRGHSVAEAVTARPSNEAKGRDVSSWQTTSSGTEKQEESPDDTSGDSWRRRERTVIFLENSQALDLEWLAKNAKSQVFLKKAPKSPPKRHPMNGNTTRGGGHSAR